MSADRRNSAGTIIRNKHHRAVDRDIVLGDEIRHGSADDDEQDRQRLDGPAVSQQCEKRDEKAQPGEQVRRQGHMVQSVLLDEPLGQPVQIQRVAGCVKQHRKRHAERGVRDSESELPASRHGNCAAGDVPDAGTSIPDLSGRACPRGSGLVENMW